MASKEAVYKIIGASNHTLEDRAPYDFYATDPQALEELLKVETFNKELWEPCCGTGHLSKVLEKHGYNVVSSDLIDRGYGMGGVDFFEVTTPVHGVSILTNPPYSSAESFVRHALDLIDEGQQVILLLKLTFLEGQKRYDLFQTNQLKTLYVFSHRIECGKNGTFLGVSSVAYGWYIFQKGYNKPPVIKWIK